MKNKMLSILCVIAMSVMTFASCAPAGVVTNASSVAAVGNPDIIARYRQLIPQLMKEQHIPGLAVAVVDETQVLWAEGFGYTDTDHKTAVTPDTIFSVQSTSKAFTAVSVLLAVQQGLLDLDTPISTYLPEFTINSIFEQHPERKITLRMLLSHTAGLTMEAPVGNNFDLGPVKFEDHVKTISDTWLRFPVGTGYAYSNLGISLAGYILQEVSGKPFAQYVADSLLNPLGMNNSSFDMDKIRANPNRAVGHTGPYPHVPLEIPIVPEGGFYTSVNDMTRFIQFHLNQGNFAGKNVLNPALLEEMYTIPIPSQGSPEGYALGIARTRWFKARNTTLLAHGGGGFGFLSDLIWLPELNIGITILTNSTDHNLQGDLALSILNDFVQDPDSIYYSRMMALDERAPVVDGDEHYRPPYNLSQTVARQAMQPSSQDGQRWLEYIGEYGAKVWGVIDPLKASVQLYQLGSGLHIKPSDTGNDLKLTEVSPGLFFAENGEALDFRGAIPTWRNVKLVKIGKGPLPWQQAVLAGCALVFVSGILYILLRVVMSSFSRRSRLNNGTGPRVNLALFFAFLTSLSGILSIGIVYAFPRIIYSGFLGWVDLPLWQRLLLHMPFVLLVTGLIWLAVNITGWKNHWWTWAESIYYMTVSLASVAVLLFYSHWHLIGLGLG